MSRVACFPFWVARFLVGIEDSACAWSVPRRSSPPPPLRASGRRLLPPGMISLQRGSAGLGHSILSSRASYNSARYPLPSSPSPSISSTYRQPSAHRPPHARRMLAAAPALPHTPCSTTHARGRSATARHPRHFPSPSCSTALSTRQPRRVAPPQPTTIRPAPPRPAPSPHSPPPARSPRPTLQQLAPLRPLRHPRQPPTSQRCTRPARQQLAPPPQPPPQRRCILRPAQQQLAPPRQSPPSARRLNPLPAPPRRQSHRPTCLITRSRRSTS